MRIVIIAPDTLTTDDPSDAEAHAQAERSRSLRIGLLQNGYNIVAVLPADVFLPERLAQIVAGQGISTRFHAANLH